MNRRYFHLLRSDLLKEQPEIDYEKWRWSINGVCEWLKTRGLSNYIPYIKQYAIHGALLFSLNEDDFKQRVCFNSLGVIGYSTNLIPITAVKCTGRVC